MPAFSFALKYLLAALLLAAPQRSAAAQVLPGPVEAHIGKIHDGDSFTADATIWPGTIVAVAIRVRGIDAPEMQAKCLLEREMAAIAKQRLADRLLESGSVVLLNVGGDKYYGRVLADVILANGSDLATAMLATGSVRPYGGKRRSGWCDPGR